MIKTVTTVEEANELAKAGYRLHSTDVFRMYDYDTESGYTPYEDRITYTMVSKFMEGISNG